MNSPLLSVITPCLNQAGYIEEAIQGVLHQDYPRIEHVIVDGGSTDETLAIVKKYAHLRVVSEADDGMYDALNKGLAVSSGEVVGFLNADDLYAPDGIRHSMECLQDGNAAVAGNAEVFSEGADGGRQTILEFTPSGSELMELCCGSGAFINAWLFRRSVFETIGTFNAAYRIVADTDFMMRFALSGLRYNTSGSLIYCYRQHPGSMTFDVTDDKYERIANEQLRMTAAYLGRSTSLPPQARQLIRASRTRDTIEATVRLARRGQISKTFPFVQAGWRHDKLWPFKLVQRAWQRIASL